MLGDRERTHERDTSDRVERERLIQSLLAQNRSLDAQNESLRAELQLLREQVGLAIPPIRRAA